MSEKPTLVQCEDGLTLIGNGMKLKGDFTAMLPRIRQSNLSKEILVRAAKIKNPSGPLRAIDATAGLGEDSILLAAAGFHVTMYEYNSVIAALLQDALERARHIPELADIAERMELVCGDSITALKEINPEEAPDVILLDPMFPARQKSALVKRKFQLLQQLEQPCNNEEELLQAAMEVRPHKLVIKRPMKGPYLGGKKPSYSIGGKAVRYDCHVFA